MSENREKDNNTVEENRSSSRLRMRYNPIEYGTTTYAVSLPPVKLSILNEQIDNSAIEGDRQASKAEIEWGKTVIDCLQTSLSRDAFSSTVEDVDSVWDVETTHKGEKITISKPVIKKTTGEQLSGEKAIMAVTHSLGIGSMITVPLWHSGFSMTLKPPSESDIVELFRLIDSDTVDIGRSTSGLVFSNMSVVLANRVVDFIIRHTYNTTIDGWKDIDLTKYIKTQDLFPMVAAMAATIYPNGFEFKRPCTTNPEECTYVAEGKVDIKKMVYTKVSDLTSSQRQHMAHRRPKSHTIEDVEHYQRSLQCISNSTVSIDDSRDFSIVLRTPTLYDYIEIGNNWISSIEKLIEEVLSSNKEDRKDIALQFSNASILRQYSQWVDEIKIDGNVINDRYSIDDVMEIFSGMDEYRVKITNSIIDYISNSAICVVGIPAYDCPSCGADQSDPKAPTGFKTIVPLDALTLFFYLETNN